MEVDPVGELGVPLVELAQGQRPDHAVGSETWRRDGALKRLDDALRLDAIYPVRAVILAQRRNGHREAEIDQRHLHEMDMAADRSASQEGATGFDSDQFAFRLE